MNFMARAQLSRNTNQTNTNKHTLQLVTLTKDQLGHREHKSCPIKSNDVKKRRNGMRVFNRARNKRYDISIQQNGCRLFVVATISVRCEHGKKYAHTFSNRFGAE